MTDGAEGSKGKSLDDLLARRRKKVREKRQEEGDGSGDGGGRGTGSESSTTIPRRAADAPAPLSFAQERLWFLDRLQPDSSAYNIPLTLELTGELDPDLLARALTALTRRQESLRTRITRRAGAVDGGEVEEELRPVQVVRPAEPVLPPRVDLLALPEEVAARTARRISAAEAGRPFVLEDHPLVRYLLVRLAPRRHYLLCTLHHVVTDGWSMGVMVRELSALYRAFAAGEGEAAAALPPLPVQYGDYAAWQRERLQGDELVRQVGYWRRRLEGAPALLELPLDRPRPPLQSYRGGRLEVVLGSDLRAAVEALARRLGATPFMVLLAAWQGLLSRLSGMGDVVVGAPIAARHQAEVEHLLGFFANTLPLRTDLSDAPSFARLVERVRDHVLEDFEYQDVPFEELVAEIKPPRNLSHAPLFQVMLAMQTAPRNLAAPEGLEMRPLSADTASAKYDLLLVLIPLEDAGGEPLYRGTLEYNADLFDAATGRRWIRHLETLLRGATERPGTSVADLPLLDEEERHRVVVEWNETGRRYDGPELLHERVARQVEATPDAPALRFRGESLTYRETAQRVYRLARRLRRLGVGPEVRVGVALERSLELPTSLLAVMEAGGAYVPVDPGYPEDRIAFMLEDALAAEGEGGGILLTQAALAERFRPLAPEGTRVVAVDDPDLALEEESPERPATAPVDPESSAYAIYTSGSTGRPKGAVNRHRAIVNRLDWMQETFRIGPGDRVLQKTPFSFDVSVWEFFWPLMTGAELVVAEPGGHQDPAYLVRTIQEAGITTLHFVPSMLQVFLGEPEVVDCTSVVRVIASGEALPPDLVRRFHQRLGTASPAERARLFNLYGPTEAAVDVTWTPCDDPDPARVTIGRPVANTRMHVVDPRFRPQPPGVPGELLIGGVQLARGYLGRPGLTAERFVADPFAGDFEPGTALRGDGRVYRTGDLGRWLADGSIEYLGRLDHQVKIRGLRIELGEIEAALADLEGVREAVVLVRGGDGVFDQRLVAYVVAQGGGAEGNALREGLRDRLPDHMVPAEYVFLPEMPVSPSGKADRKALARIEPEDDRRRGAGGAALPSGELERRLVGIWKEVLGHDRFSVQDNFFDVGGHSLLVMQVQRALRRELGHDLRVLDLFRFPTLRSLADHLKEGGGAGGEEAAAAVRATPAAVRRREDHQGRVAVVGMAGRFPGAADLAAFWENLRRGTEALQRYSLDEVLAEGVPEEVARDPHYVLAGIELEDPDRFDAGFFDYSPREAQLIDPQQRLFLETSWHALEDAAIDPARFPGRIGVFAGAAENWYLGRIAAQPRLLETVGNYQALISNKSDYLPTRVAYKLGLTGPAVNVQTACSTSLVAVHLACRALLAGDCEAALAGGSSVGSGRRRGYRWDPGGIASPDGHTRTFDAAGRGTMRGHGVGVVVLRRLEDALADGDPIHAVLLGTAINNDGGLKIGFTAPSVEGQERVVRDACRTAGVEPGSIGYVEAHGTATEMGDPIEVEALRRAYGKLPAGSIALGSVKTNVGHLDAAAGVAGLVKTVLALEHGELPPSLHFETPNPRLELESSPFRVQTGLGPWPRREGDGGPAPRRAAVSAFGIGGTNAHAVLEEAPPAPPSAVAPEHVALPLSARSPGALAAAAAGLADWLERCAAVEAEETADGDEVQTRRRTLLADAAWTLQVGRRDHEHRRVVVAADPEEAVAALRGTGPAVASTANGSADGTSPPVAFLLSGQGAQYPGMGRALHEGVEAFRAPFERCRKILGDHLETDLLDLVTGDGAADGAGAAQRLRRTDHAQPALFAVEYSLARLLADSGIVPAALLGHSLGEYVAACLAGVLTLEDALAVVAARGRLMEAMPAGSMLAVELPEAAVAERLADREEPGARVELAAVNGPAACVVSGPAGAVESFHRRLEAEGVACRPLHTSHAFHSALMDGALEPFREVMAGVTLARPRIPFLSNVTGTWITDAEATDPDYWVRHLRAPVRFAAGAAELLADPERVFLEVGPGRTLRTLLRQQPEAAGRTVLPTLRHPREQRPDLAYLLATLGRLWVGGSPVDWRPVAGEGRRRLRLPSYPFQRTRHWVEAPRQGAAPAAGPAAGATGTVAVRESPLDAGAEEALSVGSVGSGVSEDRDGLTPLEQRIAAAWRDLLGVDRVRRHDDFFDLGGNSLVAVRLASRLRGALGVEVDAHGLLDHPTLEGLANHLAALHPELTAEKGEGPPTDGAAETPEAPATPSSLLVRLRGGGTAEPVFFVHPAGGHVLYYRHVAAALADGGGGSPGRPVFGLRARGLEEGEEPLDSVEAMAQHYLQALRQERPHGPYHLVGSSFGGTVAWEMARRLGEAGETVATLALVDTFGPGWMPPRESIALPEHGVPSAYLGGARPEELADLRRVRAVMAANVEAMYAYSPPPWPGRLLFLRATERSGEAEPARPEQAWIGLAEGGVEVHVVPGGHNGMHAPPHAAILAARLGAAVRRGEIDPACPAFGHGGHS